MRDVGDEQSASFWRMVLDRFAFPVLVISAVALAGGLYMLRRDVDHIEWAFARLQQDVAANDAEFASFRSPGDRFTAADGARHDARITRIEQECEQCQRSKTEVMLRLSGIEKEQEKLCQRIIPCNHDAPALRRSPP